MKSTIQKNDDGWLLTVDDHWPIGLFRSAASAQAVASILDRLSNIPEWTAVDLCYLAGVLPSQALGPMKRKRIAFAWGRNLTERWHGTLVLEFSWHGNEHGILSRGLAGQVLPPFRIA